MVLGLEFRVRDFENRLAMSPKAMFSGLRVASFLGCTWES